MASIRSYGFFKHLRAELNEHVLYFSGGKLALEGTGVAFWYMPLNASLALVPAEDRETTFVVKALTKDLQENSVQVSVVYRFNDPQKAARRVNFSIHPGSGLWLEAPLEKVATFWAKRSIQPVRDYLATTDVVEAMVKGPAAVREQLLKSLKGDEELTAMGLAVVDAHVTRLAPAPEMEKAVQTPSREALQQKADEAVFSRRALAVEKERAIKENELANEIELARRQEQLIQRQGDNRKLEAQRAAEAAKVAAESQAEIQRLTAEAGAAASTAVSDADYAAEAKRVELYRNAPTSIALGFAAQSFADKLQSIQNFSITPDMLGDALQRLAGAKKS
jgi:regulator of protease activity HflC (stomatin/prohibitin superfamily)